MFQIYTVDALSSKHINELKLIAHQMGAAVFGDHRRKSSFVNAIVSHQQATVELVQSICDELVAEHEAEIAEAQPQLDFAAEEAAILAEIESVGDALNSFILSDAFAGCDCPEIRRLEEELDALNQRYQEMCSEHLEAIGANYEPIVDIWWQGENNGSVSIDGGNSYRAFRVLDMQSDCPIVKLVSSKKNELDSRWVTTKNNRYMQAVLEAIPARIQQLASEIWEDGEIVGYEDNGEGPINRGDGRGGRIEFVEF